MSRKRTMKQLKRLTGLLKEEYRPEEIVKLERKIAKKTRKVSRKSIGKKIQKNQSFTCSHDV